MAERDQEDADADPDGLDNEGSFGEDGIRRPMNAFFIFCKRHRDVVREKYPHLENRSITKILGEWWANLDASEKSSYTDLAKEYRNVFMKAHPDFKWYKAPSAPTRTLVTRPSNRGLQVKKEKSNLKSLPCEIALAKLVDKNELGGLSCLISQNSSDSMSPTADIKCHEASLSPVPSSSPSSCSSQPSPSSASILKPPKKRYLVNGEFKCNSKEEAKVDGRDFQTQNACSALMELAEICANTAPHTQTTTLPAVSTTIGEGHGLYKSIFNFPKLTNFKSYTGLDPIASSSSYLNRAPSSTSITYIEPTSPSCSREYLPRHSGVSSVPDYQEQPLNLCKEKEKTFRTSNQQIINHLVDKFLCDSPSAKSASSSSVLDSSVISSTSPSFPKSSQLRQGFTLSAAIESAIDQAYSRTPPSSSTSSASPVTKKEPAVVEEPDTGFIDKIKKACLASSRLQSEKQRTNNRYSLPLELQDEISKPLSVVKEDASDDAKATPESKTESVNSDSTSESSGSANSLKREIKFSSSKYYSKYASPPKKSRVWCNLFMKEQLSNCDLDNEKTALLYDLASPVRRNSTRTCKGRRYQALITEGLLQSTKERKGATGRKTTPPNEKCRTKTSPLPESPPPLPKSKRKKKDHERKAKSTQAESAAKNEFDLNEKIASLPKCSIETLNKKKRTTTSSESSNDSKSNSTSSSKAAKKAAKQAASTIDAESISEKSNEDNSASSGRFKTGGFDLEQHIASLPKCDIEVLNKRRNKKE